MKTVRERSFGGRARLGAATTMRCVFAVLLALGGACTPAPMPVATSAHDPSNPSAPEGVTSVNAASAPSVSANTGSEHDRLTASSPDASAQSPPSDHSAHSMAASDGGSEEAVYVCPMHPEVTARTPGLCPKCNMKLVPRK